MSTFSFAVGFAAGAGAASVLWLRFINKIRKPVEDLEKTADKLKQEMLQEGL